MPQSRLLLTYSHEDIQSSTCIQPAQEFSNSKKPREVTEVYFQAPKFFMGMIFPCITGASFAMATPSMWSNTWLQLEMDSPGSVQDHILPPNPNVPQSSKESVETMGRKVTRGCWANKEGLLLLSLSIPYKNPLPGVKYYLISISIHMVGNTNVRIIL